MGGFSIHVRRMRDHCNTPFPVLTRERPPKRRADLGKRALSDEYLRSAALRMAQLDAKSASTPAMPTVSVVWHKKGSGSSGLPNGSLKTCPIFRTTQRKFAHASAGEEKYSQSDDLHWRARATDKPAAISAIRDRHGTPRGHVGLRTTRNVAGPVSEHQRGRDCRRIRYGVGCRHTGASRILSAGHEQPGPGWRSSPQSLRLPLRI